MNSSHSSDSSLSSNSSKSSSGSHSNSSGSFVEVIPPSTRLVARQRELIQSKQAIIEQKVAHLKSLFDIQKDMSKIASISKNKKIVDEMIHDAAHIMKYYGIKLKIIREDTFSTPYEYQAVTNLNTLCYALLSIVSMFSEFPFSFVTKLGIPELVICNDLTVREEKHKPSLKQKLLSGVFVIDTICFNDFYEHLGKIFLHYLLKKSTFKQDWDSFLSTIANYFKFDTINPLEDLTSTWELYTRVRRGQFYQKDELKTLKLDKLAHMLKGFDSDGFDAPEPKMPPVKKQSLRPVPVTRAF